MHAKRTCLYSDGATWGKTESEDLFDVTMGSWDGAETCELVGSYMLSLIREKHGDNVGLYRDNGLGAFNATPQEVEKTKKSLCKIFRDNGLKITVEANLGKVNFLDVTLDLIKSSFAPYTKPNNTTLYVHAQSNHPPSIIKNTPPPAIYKRLSELSSNEAEFNNAKPPYQEELKIVATITSSSTYKRTRSAGRKVEKETLFSTTHRFQVTSRQTWENPS